MATSRSRAVAARQRAAERVRQQEQKRLDQITDAAAGVMDTATTLGVLRVQVEQAEAELRAHVAVLLGLGKTAEEIAELAEVDVSVVNDATVRPKREPSRRRRADGGPADDPTRQSPA